MNSLAILAGALLAFGAWAIVGAFRPATPNLAAALERLNGERPESAGATSGLDRAGHWLRGRLRPVSAQTERRLRLAGRSLDRHYTYKVLGALAGLVLASLVGAILANVVGAGFALPALAALGAALLGYVWPDLALRNADPEQRQDTTESLLTYFDLVTLERLSNRSGAQSLRAAAAMSDVPVFTAIRDALERARLEQRPPYDELRQLGRKLEIPALVDLAEVMALDDAGASLADALRARVRELRDAHLTQARIAASAVSERMAFFMVIPSLVFGLIFLVPPLLRLLEA